MFKSKSNPEKEEQKACEDATGCVQRGGILYYNTKAEKITIDQANWLLDNAETIEVPAAGAGSYRQVFVGLGFEDVKTIDTTSSAGDWTLGVKSTDGWLAVSQENRYPYYGYRYSFSDLECCETFERLCEIVENI